jgi:hypothetical protein
MPFVRTEADAEAPLLITLGTVDAASPAPPPRQACELLAAALGDAGLRPLRLMVRFDYRGVIVRGDVTAGDVDAVARALETVPGLAALARRAVDLALDRPPAPVLAPLPPGLHLLTGRFDEAAAAWRLSGAHGFADGVWHRTPDG